MKDICGECLIMIENTVVGFFQSSETTTTFLWGFGEVLLVIIPHHDNMPV